MKSTFNLKYTVHNGGWAAFEIGDIEKAVTLNISFFHDSLKELAQSAIDPRTKNRLFLINELYLQRRRY